jgi:monovalent cation:H+ antiporter-2, CPA2 family
MQHLDLILTFTVGLAAALAFGYLTHRVGLSPIVGYLLAGIAVGPNTPGFVANRELAEQMAEIGVILLMFGVGLHFQLGDLLAVRRVAIPGALAQVAASAGLGTLAALAFGSSAQSAVAFGLTISIASTVVVTRVLADNNDLHTPAGHVAVGWLVVQDLCAVLVLVLMPTLFGADAVSAGRLPAVIGLAALKIGALVVGLFLVGGRLIPWLLRHVAATHSRELFTLTVLVVALGIAVGSSLLFGASMALGAFLAGMVVGRSDFSVRAATEALPMRDAFAVLFFVSAGMLFDPRSLLQAPGLGLATLAVVLVGTPLIVLGLVLALGYPMRLAASVALALTQVGEFSFILADVGRREGLLGADAVHALVAVAIVSISVNPVLYRLADPLALWIDRRARLRSLLAVLGRRNRGVAPHRPPGPPPDPQYRAVVVGYGPIGRTLVRLLRQNEVEPTVIELNLETVNRLRAEGLSAVYGDANQPETLRQVGLDRVGTLILSASEFRGGEEVIRVARQLNPNIRILARSAYLREVPTLRRAGADAVFAGEGEVALAMTEAVLRELGATPEQIDRERDRLRSDLRQRFDPATADGPTVDPPTPPADNAQTAVQTPQPLTDK